MATYLTTMKPGENIHDAAKRACELAKQSGLLILFTFNDTQIYVHPCSFVEDIVQIYFLRRAVQ